MSNRPCLVVLVTWRGLGFLFFASLDAIAGPDCSEVEMSFQAYITCIARCGKRQAERILWVAAQFWRLSATSSTTKILAVTAVSFGLFQVVLVAIW